MQSIKSRSIELWQQENIIATNFAAINTLATQDNWIN